MLRAAYGLEGESFVFNAWPPARTGEPEPGEYREWDPFEDKVVAAVRS